MTTAHLAEQIANRTDDLPPELQTEILDFVEFIRSRRLPHPDMREWLAEVWGSAPDFPDWPAQPPLEWREPW